METAKIGIRWGIDIGSLPTTLTAVRTAPDRRRESAAGALPARRNPAATIKAPSVALRINEVFAMCGPFANSLHGVGYGDAEAHHVDAPPAPVRVGRFRLVLVGINKAAQSERERAELAGKGEGLCLRR